jgi:hypothetical protein
MLHRRVRETLEKMTELAPLRLPDFVVQPARAFMHDRTVAFWGHHERLTNGEPVLYGSGVLLQVAEARFIVTAAHVCDLFLNRGLPALIGAGAHKLVPLDETGVRYSKKADIALVPLSEQVWSALSTEKKFTRLSEIAAHDPTDESGGIYCAFGYPTARSTTDHEARLHTMIAQHAFGLPYPKTKQPIEDFDPRLHIAIEFDRTSHAAPGGMSGGGIWRIHQGGVPAAGWSVDDIRLVAIEHTHGITDRALVGTRFGYLATLIEKFDPSLAPAMDLAYVSRARTLNERLVRDG